MNLTREINITPAFDKRSDNPKKDYGISSCRIFFIVKGKKGAITINFGTNWYLYTTVQEYKHRGINGRIVDLETSRPPLEPWSWDYHSRIKHYDDQEPIKSCDFLNGDDCYCDGSCLKAVRYKEILLSQGSEGLFKELEKDYEMQFGMDDD